jgi:UDP-glucuronate decarboxylase
VPRGEQEVTSARAQTALVTGAAGFLGSHLVDRLLARGCQVIALDNLQTGFAENLAHHTGNPRFSFIKADVTEALDIEADLIFNLACPASPPQYQADPVHTLKTSVLGTLNLLELAARHKARLLHVSTSEVYGDPQEHPQRESYWGHVNPIGPRACYDEGKRAAETLCFDFLRKHMADVRVARVFNTYGPRMHPDDGRVVSNFIMQALQDKPLTIYGDGAQTRAFCYVDDLMDGLLALMDRHDAPDGPVNLGNTGEFTIRDLAEQVLRLTGSRSAFKKLPLPHDDPRQRRPDISRARTLLGWEPKVALELGLTLTIAHYRDVLRQSSASHP